MRIIGREEAIRLFMDTVPGNQRSRTDPFDFGGEETHLLFLRRFPWPGMEKADLDKDYGFYLGRHGEEWVVLRKLAIFPVTGGEAFSSLEELKQHWSLD